MTEQEQERAAESVRHGPAPDGVDPVLWHAIETWVPKRSLLAQKVRKQMLVLYCLLIGCFVLLAYRTESNANDIREGLYESCTRAAERAENYNPGRIAVADLLIDLVADSDLTAEQKTAATDVMVEGLTLTPDKCEGY